MRNYPDKVGNHEFEQHEELLIQHCKHLERIPKDILDVFMSIEDLQAMVIEIIEEKPELASMSAGFPILRIQDEEGDDDARAYFPCPFCYVDIEIPVLCSHLQEEHCFDLKNAVCPLCAANLGKDVIGHFTLQHAHSLKRRRKSQKSGAWTNSPLRELSSFLGSRGNSYESAPDPLLSPFLCSISVSDGNQQDKCSSDNASFASDMKSTVPSTPSEGQEQDYEERQQRAIFVQQLIGSTIF